MSDVEENIDSYLSVPSSIAPIDDDPSSASAANVDSFLDAPSALVPEKKDEPKDEKYGAMQIVQNASNAPFAGLSTSYGNSLVGAAQAVAQGAHKIGLMGDDAYSGINNKISDLQNMQQQDINSLDPLSKTLYGGGQLAGNVSQFMAMPGEGLLPSFLKGSTQGAIQPVESGDTSVLGIPVDNRALNAGVGGSLSAIGQGVGDLLSTQVTDPTKQVAMQMAADNNIPVFRSQVSSNPFVKAAASFEKEVPFSGGSSNAEKQAAAFNQKLNESIGQTGDALTPETMNAADKNISGVYDKMTSKYDLQSTPDFETKLLQINDEVPTLGDQGKEHALQSQVNAVMSKIKNNKISGPTYQGLRSQISGLMRGPNSSPQLGNLLNTLDDQFQSGMNVRDLVDFQSARGQYRNMLSLEKVVANSPNEAITPSKLQGAVKSVFGNYAYGGGSSNLESLARVGNLINDSFPNSGTATRQQVYELAKKLAGPAIGMGIGGGEGYRENGLQGAALGAAGGLALNRALISPYLYSKMSLHPSLVRELAPAIESSLPFSFSPSAKGQ